jgi:uroporphyrinogen decarboxylase
MNSKERVRNAIAKKPVDRVPAAFEATPFVWDLLMKEYGYQSREKVLERFEIDLRSVGARYIGPRFEKKPLNATDFEQDTWWGNRVRTQWTGREFTSITCAWPLNEARTPEDVDAFRFAPMEWFDFDAIKAQAAAHPDKALVIGHEGTYQVATFLRREDLLYEDMAAEPELAMRLFDRMHEWEMEYYERCFRAGGGAIDVLRVHDDYGTQRAPLFSTAMWKTFFEKNTRELADLAHRHGAYFQQHSCGCITPFIPELIKCGVDALEPLQPVEGMKLGSLKAWRGELAFFGGICTQQILPFGTPQEVRREVRSYIDALHGDGTRGGYILHPSQSWESCIPVANIEALYSLRN